MNQDHFVDAADASQVLAMYVEASTQGRAFSSTEISLADMNRDNKIDSADASMILAEYVNSSTDYSG
ncbi:dockerin type I domain-containing protein [Ruminococcus flavefaciens]|uniref:dockerin type I domain-containing protein n=1 Tax=Ruminococcus flavefaciens TaxID=1265 RepID=UPI002418794E|nr:dockerin type I domain-containing protein [Ruminococcus flavefaciens]